MAVYLVVLLHEVSDGLQLGVERLDAEGLGEHPQSPAGDQRVLHVDALLALFEDKLEELLLDRRELTYRAINESLPLLDLPLRLDASANPINFLVPLGQKWEGHAENLTCLVDGEIMLQMEPVALLQKHDLLDEGIPLADLASCPPRRPEEEGARHCERKPKSSFQPN